MGSPGENGVHVCEGVQVYTKHVSRAVVKASWSYWHRTIPFRKQDFVTQVNNFSDHILISII